MAVKRIHLVSSVLAAFIILLFLLSTLMSELFGSEVQVAQVKRLIVMPGLLLLIPTIAAAGATGTFLGRGRKARFFRVKTRRTLIIALTGIFVLVPSAITLNMLASQGLFGPLFYSVQGLELLAGMSNLYFIGRNAYDGLKLAGRLKPNRGKAVGQREEGR